MSAGWRSWRYGRTETTSPEWAQTNNNAKTMIKNIEIKDIETKFKELVSDSAPTVQDAVVDRMVSAEVCRRTDIITKLVSLSVIAERETLKVKPDIVAYNEEGEVVSSNWSKGKLEERKKLADKLASYEKAFKEALEDNNYTLAEKLTTEPKNDKPQGN